MTSVPAEPREVRPRREYGTGSITQLPNGKQRVWVSLGRDPRTGKRLRHSVLASSESEAKKVRKELLRQKDAGQDLINADTPFGEICERWFATLRARPQGDFSPNTLRGYRLILDRYVKPRVGKLKVGMFSWQHLEDLQDDLFSFDLSSQTVLNVRNCLRGPVTYALQRRLLLINPFDLVKAPAGSRGRDQIIEPEGAKRFLEVIRGHRLEAAFLMEIAMGCRRAEVIGLCWPAIDLTPGKERLAIRSTLHRLPALGHFTLEPKSHRGKRTLAIPQRVWSALRARKTAQELERTEPRPLRIPPDQDWVFTSPRTGGPCSPNSYSHWLKKCLIEAGVGHLCGHSLRHSVNTILIEKGLSPLGAMNVLGHASTQVSMGIYGHQLDSSRVEAARIMDRWLDEVSDG
jgi:integrase